MSIKDWYCFYGAFLSIIVAGSSVYTSDLYIKQNPLR